MPSSYQVTPAILGRRRATQRITATPAAHAGRSAAGYRVSPPPARGPTGRVGRHRPQPRTLTQRPVIRHDRLKETAILSRFPVAFPLPAFASRSSDSRRGVGPSLRSAYRTTPAARTSTGFPRSARMSYDRGGCPLYPEDGGAHPDRRRARPAPAASQRPVLSSPPPAFHRRGPLNEASTRVQAIQPSGLPLAWRPRTERAPLGLFPELRTPPTKSRTTHVEEGTGHEHGPGTTRSTHISRTSNRAFTHYVRPRVAPPEGVTPAP